MDRFVVVVVVVVDDDDGRGDDGRGAGDESLVKSSMNRCSMTQETLMSVNRCIRKGVSSHVRKHDRETLYLPFPMSLDAVASSGQCSVATMDVETYSAPKTQSSLTAVILRSISNTDRHHNQHPRRLHVHSSTILNEHL